MTEFLRFYENRTRDKKYPRYSLFQGVKINDLVLCSSVISKRKKCPKEWVALGCMLNHYPMRGSFFVINQKIGFPLTSSDGDVISSYYMNRDGCSNLELNFQVR